MVGDTGWEVVQLPPLDLERDEDGTYVVSDAVLLVYGSGDTEQAAREDYTHALIEYAEIVEAGARQGSEKDQRELRRVQGYVRRKE